MKWAAAVNRLIMILPALRVGQAVSRCAHPSNGFRLEEKDGHDFEVTEHVLGCSPIFRRHRRGYFLLLPLLVFGTRHGEGGFCIAAGCE